MTNLLKVSIFLYISHKTHKYHNLSKKLFSYAPKNELVLKCNRQYLNKKFKTMTWQQIECENLQ